MFDPKNPLTTFAGSSKMWVCHKKGTKICESYGKSKMRLGKTIHVCYSKHVENGKFGKYTNYIKI